MLLYSILRIPLLIYHTKINIKKSETFCIMFEYMMMNQFVPLPLAVVVLPTAALLLVVVPLALEVAGCELAAAGVVSGCGVSACGDHRCWCSYRC